MAVVNIIKEPMEYLVVDPQLEYDGLMPYSDKDKLDGIQEGAEANQNAFSNIIVGGTTIAADSKTDSVTLVAGNNVTLTPDATNDKVTIASKDTTYTFGNGTNSFTVTPSGGSAQTVTVTPSIPVATTSANGLMSSDDKTKLNGIAAGAEVNQNAFSNVKVGSTTVAADAKTDTIELAAGSNITLTPDATNDKITIAATDTNTTYTVATGDSNGQIKITPSAGNAYNVGVKGLGSAAYKNATTSVTSGSGDLVTSGAVWTAIDNLPEPMVFKGSLGTGGTITTLPAASSANTGHTYKVITAGTYASQAAKVGDLFISDGTAQVYIPSADEPSGTVTSIAINANSPITVDSSSAITTSGTRTIGHANSGVTAGTYRSVTVNATGHVTGGSNPTTIAGYGITDAKIASGTITLGSNSITPLTSFTETDPTVPSWAKAASKPTYTAAEVGAAASSHTHATSIATSTGTNQLTLAANTKYAISAGGTSFVFTTPADTNTWRPVQNNLTSDSTSDSLSAAQGKALKALVDGKAASGHTHATSIATSTGTNQLTMAANTKYAITAGGTSYIFTTPPDTNTWRGIQDNLTSTSTSDSLSANQGRLLANGSARDSTKLPLSGGSMTGTLTFNKVANAISYTGTKATYQMIKFKDNTNDEYGNGIVIGGGGLTVIGGGESANTVAATHTTGGDEILELTSDGNVQVWTNVQDGATNAKKFIFGTDGVLSTPAGVSGLTKSQVTTALGYTPPTSDTNTHRPIQVNGTEILGNNTTALNLKAGSNVSLTNSSGTVTIAATNTNTTYTFASGTNGFTVTPSGGTAQTVTVTPSISNNVTGSGTNGYIAKWNGTNTVTNGPAFGSATNTYLRNDGTWATPTDTNNAVTQTATTTSANYEVLFSVTADNTTRTEGARKNSNLKFNPSTGNLQATQLNGVTIGSSPKFTDTNTHRPIQVKGTQILGDNTTALNFNNGTNISLSNSNGTVVIGQQYVLRKIRKRVAATGWSNSTDANGYYSLLISIEGYDSQDYTYPPNVYIAGSTDSTFPTDAEKEQYALLEQCESQYSSVDAGTVVLYAKTKPTADFYVYIELMLKS